jgi:hypothetical protein
MTRRFIKWEDPFAKMVVSGLIGGAGVQIYSPVVSVTTEWESGL